MKLPKRVEIVEVGPRDGLQNEKDLIATGDKIELINRLSRTGLKHIEITSFVNPRWIPQLADSAQVATTIDRLPGVTYSALVPNLKGYEQSVSAQIDTIVVFLSASESHSRKNINKSIAEAEVVLKEVTTRAIADGKRVRCYISTVFGCPYEGDADPEVTVRLTEEILGWGAYQVAISDTTGVANPQQVQDVLQRLYDRGIRADQLALHVHDTRGTALANILAALQMGITTFDSSIGGLGGCPYAPGATGNVATDDLNYLLQSMGIETGVDSDKLFDASCFMQHTLAKKLPSRYFQSQLAACSEGSKSNANAT